MASRRVKVHLTTSLGAQPVQIITIHQGWHIPAEYSLSIDGPNNEHVNTTIAVTTAAVTGGNEKDDVLRIKVTCRISRPRSQIAQQLIAVLDNIIHFARRGQRQYSSLLHNAGQKLRRRLRIAKPLLSRGISKAKRYARGLGTRCNSFASSITQLQTRLTRQHLRHALAQGATATFLLILISKAARNPPVTPMTPWLPNLTFPRSMAATAVLTNSTVQIYSDYGWLNFPHVESLVDLGAGSSSYSWPGAPFFPPSQVPYSYDTDPVGTCQIPIWHDIRRQADHSRRQAAKLAHPDKLAAAGISSDLGRYIEGVYKWSFEAVNYILDVHEQYRVPSLDRNRRRGDEDEKSLAQRHATLKKDLANLLAVQPDPNLVLESTAERDLASSFYAASTPLHVRALAVLVQDVLPCRGSAFWSSSLWDFIGDGAVPMRLGKTAGGYSPSNQDAGDGMGRIERGHVDLFISHLDLLPEGYVFPDHQRVAAEHIRGDRFEDGIGGVVDARLGRAGTDEQQLGESFFGGQCRPEFRGSTQFLGGDVFFWRDVRRWLWGDCKGRSMGRSMGRAVDSWHGLGGTGSGDEDHGEGFIGMQGLLPGLFERARRELLAVPSEVMDLLLWRRGKSL